MKIMEVSLLIVRATHNDNQNKKNTCDYCGWNIEEQDLEVLRFFHSDCWKEYRKDGLLYPMPEEFW
jgi:hypothetical protein